MTKYIDARALADRLGLKTTKTLREWRREGKGPTGWFHLSQNRVVYPLEQVEAWEQERRGAPVVVPAGFLKRKGAA